MTNLLSVGTLKKALDIYKDDVQVAVRVPGGAVYAISSLTMVSVGAHAPLMCELLTEKDLDTRKIVPIKLGSIPG